MLWLSGANLRPNQNEIENMVKPRLSRFLTVLWKQVCRFARMYLGTSIEREKYNIMHDTYLLKRYPNFNVYIRSIVSILLRIYPITSKSHHMPPIILSFPFDVIIQQFVRSDDTNNYIKLKGSISPWLIQVCLFCCTMTKSCDCDPSFDAMSWQLYEHRLEIFKYSTIVDTYKNNEAMFGKPST